MPLPSGSRFQSVPAVFRPSRTTRWHPCRGLLQSGFSLPGSCLLGARKETKQSSSPGLGSRGRVTSYVLRSPGAAGKRLPAQAVVCFAGVFERKGESLTGRLNSTMNLGSSEGSPRSRIEHGSGRLLWGSSGWGGLSPAGTPRRTGVRLNREPPRPCAGSPSPCPAQPATLRGKN